MLGLFYSLQKGLQQLPQDPSRPFTKDTLFKLITSSRESVASRTNKAVRTILDAEIDERVAKTLRLRKQRHEMESITAPPSKKGLRKSR